MFRLILHQILLRKYILLIIILTWVGGYYLLKNYKNDLFSQLTYFFNKPSLPYKQDKKKAQRYLREAQIIIYNDRIKLDLMRASCKESVIRYTKNTPPAKLDWLERLKNWRIDSEQEYNLTRGQVAYLANMPEYWQTHQPKVFEAFHLAITATQFAYEVSMPAWSSKNVLPNLSEQTGHKKSLLFIVPRLVESYARAVCQPYPAMLVWNNYIEFQEQRAARKKVASTKNQSTLSMRSILNELKGSPLYKESLRSWLGGSIPNDFTLGRDLSFCHKTQQLRLVCISPYEAITAYQKLLHVEAQNNKPRIHLQLAQAIFIASQKERSKKGRVSLHKKALLSLQKALKDYATQCEAQTLLTAYWVREKKNYQKAWKHLRKLHLLRRQPNFSQTNFEQLAKQTLTGLGRLKDADCFHTQPHYPYASKKQTKKNSYCSQITFY